MTKKINLSSLNIIYLCIMVVYMAIREVLPLNFLIDHAAVSAVIFLGGGMLILWDLVKQRNCLRGRMADLLILFLVVCCASSVVNIKYGFFGNLKMIAALVLEFLLFFTFSKGKSKEELSKAITCITSVLMITWAILTFFSVMTYFFSVDYIIYGKGSWGMVNQGFSTEFMRLWGVFQDPNYASITCIISAFSALRLILIKRSWSVRMLCALNILLQLVYLVLGGSRAGMLLLLFAAAALCLWRFVFSKGFNFKNAAKGAGAAIVSVVLCIALISGFKVALPAVKSAVFPEETPAVVNDVYAGLYDASGLIYLPYSTVTTMPSWSPDPNLQQPSEFDPNAERDQNGSLDRTDQKEDVTNGRLKRWRHALSIFLKAPILGTSPRNISAFAKEHDPETLMAIYGIASHNGYIDVLVSTGIVGFLVLAAAVLMGAVAALKKFFRKGSSFDVAYLTILLIVLAASAVFISEIYMIFSMGALFFWLIMGFIYHYDQEAENDGLVFKLFNKLFRRKDEAK